MVHTGVKHLKKTAQRTPRKTAAKTTTRRQTRSKKATETAKPSTNPGRRYELIGLACVAVGLIACCGLAGLNVGFVGLYAANFLHYLFGVGAFPATLVILLIGWQYMARHQGLHYSLRFFGLFLLFASVLAIWHHFVIPAGAEILPESLTRGGGLFGGAILFVLRKFFGVDGSIIILGVSVIGSVLLSTTWSLANGLNKTQATAEKGATVAASAAGTVLSATADKVAAAGSAVEEHVAEKVRDLRAKHFYDQEADAHFPAEEGQTASSQVMPEQPEAAEADSKDLLTGIMPHIELVSPSEVTPVQETAASPAAAAAVTTTPGAVAAAASVSAPHPAQPKPISHTARPFTIQYSSDNDEPQEDVDAAAALDAIVHSQRSLTEEKVKAAQAVAAGNAALAAEQTVQSAPSAEQESQTAQLAEANRAAADSLTLEAIAQLLPEEAASAEEPVAGTSAASELADADSVTEAQPVEEAAPAELGTGVPDQGDRPALGDYLRPSTAAQTIKSTKAELGTGVPAAGDKPALGDYLRPTPKQSPEAAQAEAAIKQPPKPYVVPQVADILEKTVKQRDAAMEIEIEEKAQILHQTLENFRVSAHIINACHGPAVTRYELEPAPGVKVSKITNLAEDIALALAAPSVRIEPIPGKAAIGIEVPNSKLEGVRLREVLESEKFAQAKSKLTVGLGKDIGGKAIFADLAKMPHLLVAGATGSGKSVCINTLICSILFKARPDEVKFIFVDPKMVELSNYNGIPHLMVPVVTEAKKAASVLNWSVQEMEKRYAKFAEHNVRNMESYNKKFPDDKMPAIVIIIDELADLMMVAPHDVEDAICRLAQKARAAGIHMVLATQRPSVDVITGIIKANIPSRISFAVSSQIDSRTILDRSGAENLLGRGDMLFYPVGAAKPVRVQGAFVSDEEVENLIDCIKAQGQEMETNEEIVAFTEKELADAEDEGKGSGKKGKRKPAMDELLPDAVDLIMSTGIASSSSVQRRFRIGYTHAARLVDTMEELGIVGPSQGSKPREIIMTQQQATEAVTRAMAADAAG